MASADADAKHAFNIKVLKRQDPSIDGIVYSTSFVVLYKFNAETAAWSKTGIEGPMFLFHRTSSPHHGLFILNRNGVDNFSVPLTQDNDIDVSDEFVILRTEEETTLEDEEDEEEEDDEDEDEETILGVWVFEKEYRQQVGAEMTRLIELAATDGLETQPAQKTNGSVAAPPSTANSISLDALFASASSPRPPPAASIGHPSGHQGPASSGPALLDALFQSASRPSPASSPQIQARASAPAAQPPPPPTQQGQQRRVPSSASLPPTADPAAGLMAMLGLGPATSIPPQRIRKDEPSSTAVSPSDSRPSLPSSPFPPQHQSHPSPLPQGLQSLFGSAGHGEQNPSSASASASPTPSHSSTPQPAATTTRHQLQPLSQSQSQPHPQTQPQPHPNGSSASSFPSPSPSSSRNPAAFQQLVRDACLAQLASKVPSSSSSTTSSLPSSTNPPPRMSKTDFVRELLSLIHTDKGFTQALYDDYLARVG